MSGSDLDSDELNLSALNRSLDELAGAREEWSALRASVYGNINPESPDSSFSFASEPRDNRHRAVGPSPAPALGGMATLGYQNHGIHSTMSAAVELDRLRLENQALARQLELRSNEVLHLNMRLNQESERVVTLSTRAADAESRAKNAERDLEQHIASSARMEELLGALQQPVEDNVEVKEAAAKYDSARQQLLEEHKRLEEERVATIAERKKLEAKLAIPTIQLTDASRAPDQSELQKLAASLAQEQHLRAQVEEQLQTYHKRFKAYQRRITKIKLGLKEKRERAHQRRSKHGDDSSSTDESVTIHKPQAVVKKLSEQVTYLEKMLMEKTYKLKEMEIVYEGATNRIEGMLDEKKLMQLKMDEMKDLAAAVLRDSKHWQSLYETAAAAGNFQEESNAENTRNVTPNNPQQGNDGKRVSFAPPHTSDDNANTLSSPGTPSTAEVCGRLSISPSKKGNGVKDVGTFSAQILLDSPIQAALHGADDRSQRRRSGSKKRKAKDSGRATKNRKSKFSSRDYERLQTAILVISDERDELIAEVERLKVASNKVRV